jgi:hypothetical protein
MVAIEVQGERQMRRRPVKTIAIERAERGLGKAEAPR